MKIKLIEASQPIKKLDYNIEHIVLPKFKEYGFDFISLPTKPNIYSYIFTGMDNNYKVKVSLELNTTDSEIDMWNNDNSDLYIADLFATLIFNRREIPLGCISSKNPDSITYAMQHVNLDEYRPATKEDMEEKRLITPKMANSRFSAMTKKEWIDVYKTLEKELDDLRVIINKEYSEEELNELRSMNFDDLPNGAYRDFQERQKYFYKTFIPNIFPLD